MANDFMTNDFACPACGSTHVRAGSYGCFVCNECKYYFLPGETKDHTRARVCLFRFQKGGAEAFDGDAAEECFDMVDIFVRLSPYSELRICAKDETLYLYMKTAAGSDEKRWYTILTLARLRTKLFGRPEDLIEESDCCRTLAALILAERKQNGFS